MGLLENGPDMADMGGCLGRVHLGSLGRVRPHLMSNSPSDALAPVICMLKSSSSSLSPIDICSAARQTCIHWYVATEAGMLLWQSHDRCFMDHQLPARLQLRVTSEHQQFCRFLLNCVSTDAMFSSICGTTQAVSSAWYCRNLASPSCVV